MASRVALVVDNPYRDLPGLVLVAMQLAKRGADCYLVPHNLVYNGRELWALAPDFVLLNYLRRNNEYLVKQIVDAGIPFGVLDTEGGVLVNLESYANTMATDEKVRASAKCVCSWGPKLADYAIRAGWFREDQVAVTGSPRFDFYAERWRQAALQLSRYADDYSEVMILINGNFPLINPGFQTPEQEVDMYVEKFGLDRESVVARQAADKEAMLQLAGLADHLAQALPSATIVYRPHPFERLETYNELLEKRENLHLLRVGTADGWILRAQAVIQIGCSTAIEAGLAGVTALTPAWIPKPAEMPAAEAVSIGINSEEEMIHILEAILNGDFAPQGHTEQAALDKVIGEWFYKIDGKSAERVAECIVRQVPLDGSKKRLRNCERMFPNRGRSVRILAHDGLAKMLNLPSDWSFRQRKSVARAVDDHAGNMARWDSSEKYFGVGQVKEIVDAVAAQMTAEERLFMGVTSAQQHGSYHFDYQYGRSVVIQAGRN